MLRPSVSTTPQTRSRSSFTSRTGAAVSISTPWLAAAFANACVETEQRLHQLAFEPAFQIIRCRLGEEIVDLSQAFCWQTSHATAERSRLHELAQRPQADTFREIWRCLQHQVSQHIRAGIE